MRKVLLCSIICTLINASLFSQCSDCNYKSDEIWVSIENDQNFQKKNGLIITNDLKLDSVFFKYGTQKLEQVFPYSKIDRLKKLYKVKFNGKRDEFISELQKNKAVKRIIKRPVENNVAVYDPSDYMWHLTQQEPNGWLWHLNKIQAAQAWDITRGNPNVKVASLDTWFDVNHPDLTNKISPKYDPYSNTAYTSDCNRDNHGTTAVSFIAAETDGGGQLAGIGFKCMLICYQAWAGSYIERAHHASLAMHADVITSSAGGWSCTSSIDEDEKLALQEILDNGTIVVMPAGNGATGTHCNYGGRDHPWKPLSPDYDERVIIVSSTGIDDKHQYLVNGVDHTHSHYPEVDICAPGYCIMGATCSKNLDNDTCVDNTWPYYGCSTGTSFATPIVAGVCALMKSVNPCLTPAQAQSIIKATADPIVDASSYSGLVGAGRINAYNAVYHAALAGTVNVNGNVYQNATYTAPYSVVCSAAITNNVTVTLQARQSIVLNTGFSVTQGCTFIMNANSNLQLTCQ